ncbi:MAG: hypothetical protein ACRDXF_05755 [Acidimicrobiia bacterium]
MSIHIEPTEGAEAAAQIPDEEFQLLVRIVVWELAMRTSPEQFEEHVEQLAAFRDRFEPDLATARKERDGRRFVAAVMADIESLPSTATHRQPSPSEPTTGLYL